MSANAPWSVKGIDPQAREIAKDLARRSGQTLGEWINQMIIDGGKAPGEPAAPEPQRPAPEPVRSVARDPQREERQPPRREREPAYAEARESFGAYGEPEYPEPYPEPRRRPTASLYPEPVRRTRFDFDDLGADELTRLARAVERLSARLDNAEHRNTLSVSSVDQSVASVLSRLELIERDQATVTGRVESAVDERIRRLEQNDSGLRQEEALLSLESSLGKIAVQLFEGEQKNAAAFAELRGGLAQTESRTQVALENVRVEVRDELQQSELRTRAVVGELREEMTGAEHRARAAFAVLREELGETENRAQGSVEALRVRVDSYETGARAALEQVRGEVRASLEQGAETAQVALESFRNDFAQSESRTRQTVDDLKNRLERTEQRAAAAPLLPPRPAPEPGVLVEQVVARVTERLEQTDGKTSEALRSLESSFAALDQRLRAAEANLDPHAAADLERAVGSKFETLAAELTSQMEAARHEVADRLNDVADNRRLDEMEAALRDLSRHVEAAEKRQSDAIERMGREVMRVTEALNARVAGVEAQAGEAAGRVAETLNARVAGVEAQVSDVVARATETLTTRVAGVEAQTGDAVARATEALNARVAEVQAQASEAVARMSETLAGQAAGVDPEAMDRLSETLGQRIAAVETQTGDAVERVVGIVEQRLQRADEAQAGALEKLGGEMARISERLADRIETAERRSAEAIEEVGDKVGEVSERLNQRYERAAAGLSERMRESEERLARVLEETRDRLDRRLAEAQRGLTEQLDQRLDARLENTEHNLADRIERKVADTRQELTQALDRRVGETERGLTDKLERSVGETRETLDRRVLESERGLADRLEERVSRTEQGLAGELQRSVGETAQQFEQRVREAERQLSATLSAQVGDAQRGIADQLDARLGETEKGFSERLQSSLAQVASRVDEVAAERLPEAETQVSTVFAPPADVFVSAAEPTVEDDEELAPFSAFASADGFRHAPLEADDPFIPPPVTVIRADVPPAEEPATDDLDAYEPEAYAPEPDIAPEPELDVVAASAPESHDSFDADDEFVTATPVAAAPVAADVPTPPSIEWSAPAPLQKWSFDVEPLDLDTVPAADAVAGSAESEAEPLDLILAEPPAAPAVTPPAAPLTSTQQMLKAAREAAKAANTDPKAGRKTSKSALDLGPPPPMAGLKGSGLRAPSIKLGGGFLSKLRSGKDEKDGAKMRTTALVAGVSFAVSAMGGGYYFLNKDADAAEGGKPGADGAAQRAEAAPADAPLAASLVVDAPAIRAPQTPSLEGATLYRTAVQSLNAGDTQVGLGLLRRAAEGNHPPAQLYLAELYETGGAGMTRDPVQARRWTDRAARLGDRKAMHNLALFHVNGEGGPVDVPAAAGWFRRAAEGGLVDSQYNLGYLYEQGRGVQASPAEAYKWYLIASRQGDAEARASVERLRPTLSPQILASAERSAAAFRGSAPAPAAPAVRNAAATPAAAAAPAAGAPEVATAQQALAQLGYYRGPADGVPSPALRRALAAWQRDAGLPVTGAPTADTLQRLATAAG